MVLLLKLINHRSIKRGSEMARRKVADELTVEMIIQEAHHQFQLNSFQKVTMRSIANGLGCSHGAIYYHFANKSELFYAVVEAYFNQLNTVMDNILMDNEGSEDKTVKVFLGFIEFGLNNQSQYEFMFTRVDKEIDPLSQQASNNSYVKFEETLQIINHEKLNANAVYASFMALHGFVDHYLGRVTEYSEAKEAAEFFTQFLLKALK